MAFAPTTTFDAIARCVLLNETIKASGQSFNVTSVRYVLEPAGILTNASLPAIDVCVNIDKEGFFVSEDIDGQPTRTTTSPTIITRLPTHYACTYLFVTLAGKVTSFTALFGSHNDHNTLTIGRTRVPATVIFSVRLFLDNHVYSYDESGFFRRNLDAEIFTVGEIQSFVEQGGDGVTALMMLDLTGF